VAADVRGVDDVLALSTGKISFIAVTAPVTIVGYIRRVTGTVVYDGTTSGPGLARRQ